MALGEPEQVTGLDILDTPFIHDTGGNQARRDQVAQPLRGVGINLVVIRGHASPHFWSCTETTASMG